MAIADRSVELGGKLVEEWNAEYKSDCICLALDLADEASVEAVINEVVGRYGRLDIAVNCVSIALAKRASTAWPPDASHL